MAKRHPFKKAKPGEPIPVTARQLENFLLEYNGKFNSRGYDKLERMELMESPVRDAIHELKTYSLETLAQRFDVRLLGRDKHVFARLDAEDNKWYYVSLAYISRALNGYPRNPKGIRVGVIFNRVALHGLCKEYAHIHRREDGRHSSS